MDAPKKISLVNVHYLLMAFLLGLTGCVKLFNANGEAVVLASLDPILGLSNRQVLLFVGATELLAVAYLFLGNREYLKHLIVLWLSVNFIAYRLAIWWVAGDKTCPCMGLIPTQSAEDGAVIDRILKATVVYMLFSSGYFLARTPVAAAVNRLSVRSKHWLKWLLRLGFSVALFPALQVGCVAVVNPPTTGPIMLRSIHKKCFGDTLPPSQYFWIDIESIPPTFLKALLAAEDNEFFQHDGFSWRHIRFALIESKTTGNPPRGASTITQQCARSLFLWQGRSWVRKCLEAYYTIWMEVLLTKQRILELYANSIEIGDGVYGIEAGAKHHFGITSKLLRTEQAAILAALLPNPKAWDPNNPNEVLIQRTEIIIRQAEELRLPQ